MRSGLTPDLILLDMMIPPPGCDGWQFLEQRRRNPAIAAVPVIIITGLGIASDEWATSLGAIGCFRKPLEVEPMLSEIRRCLAG